MSSPSKRPVILSPAALKQLGSVSSATLTTQLLKRGLTNTFMHGLAPLRPQARMLGYAFTLRYVPAREDVIDRNYDNYTNMQRLAVEAIGREDVALVERQ